MNLLSKFKRRGKPTSETPFLNVFEGFNGNIIDVEHVSPIFIVGVGRSGTHFLADVFNQNLKVKAFHLDNLGTSTPDSYQLFTQWNELNTDFQSFEASRSFLIDKVHPHQFVESNPYLSLSITDLANAFPKSRFIVTHRDPREVVLSHLNKGWYDQIMPSPCNNKLPNYDYRINNANHFFGRIIPKKKAERIEWNKLTRVGKISWMWKSINEEILKQIALLDKKRVKIVNINDFDFHQYSETLSYIGANCDIKESQFNSLVRVRPGNGQNKKINSWDEKAEKEFYEQTREIKFPH